MARPNADVPDKNSSSSACAAMALRMVVVPPHSASSNLTWDMDSGHGPKKIGFFSLKKLVGEVIAVQVVNYV